MELCSVETSFSEGGAVICNIMIRKGPARGRSYDKSNGSEDFRCAEAWLTWTDSETNTDCTESEGELKERTPVTGLKFKLPLCAALWWPFVTHAHARTRVIKYYRIHVASTQLNFILFPVNFRCSLLGRIRTSV